MTGFRKLRTLETEQLNGLKLLKFNSLNLLKLISDRLTPFQKRAISNMKLKPLSLKLIYLNFQSKFPVTINLLTSSVALTLTQLKQLMPRCGKGS